MKEYSKNRNFVEKSPNYMGQQKSWDPPQKKPEVRSNAAIPSDKPIYIPTDSNPSTPIKEKADTAIAIHPLTKESTDKRPTEVSVVPVEDITNNNIKWFGLQQEEGLTLTSAAVFDVPLAYEELPALHSFDYVDLSPLDDKWEDEVTGTSLKLTATPDQGWHTLTMAVEKVTGDAEVEGKNSKKIVELVQKGTESGKVPLVIRGHGGSWKKEGWGIGSHHDNTSIQMPSLLENLGDILGSVNSESSDLNSRYSIAILESCNGKGVTLDQQTVDKMGIPVAYTTTIVEVGVDPNAMRLVYPSEKET